MVSRRHTLQWLAGTVAVLPGCTGRDGPATPSDTPADLPEWRPEWTLAFAEHHVPALEPGDDLFYATLSSQDGTSGLAATDRTTGDHRAWWLP